MKLEFLENKISKAGSNRNSFFGEPLRLSASDGNKEKDKDLIEVTPRSRAFSNTANGDFFQRVPKPREIIIFENEVRLLTMKLESEAAIRRNLEDNIETLKWKLAAQEEQNKKN